MRDIVRRTDLASGTFYNYFPDKETVFRALVEERVVPLRAAVREARWDGDSLRSLVRSGFRAYFEFIASDPALLELLQRNAGAIRTLFATPVLGRGRGRAARGRAGSDRARRPAARGRRVPHRRDGRRGLELATLMVERRPPDVEGAARSRPTCSWAGSPGWPGVRSLEDLAHGPRDCVGRLQRDEVAGVAQHA